MSTKPNNALSACVSHTHISRDRPQSNQRIPCVTQDLESSGSEIYNNKLGGPDSQSEGYADHLRVMMQTRVAVRDKTPHRFQIVPLREVANLGLNQTEGSTRLSIPTTPMNILHHSPSGKLGPYSQTRSLQSASPIRSLNQPCEEDHDAQKPDSREDSYLESPFATDITPRSADHPQSRKVLAEVDLNRDTRVSTATTKPLSKRIGRKSVALHSRDLLTSFSGTSIAQTTPHASTGFHPRQDGKHHTLTTLGAHISEISQLFSSENVASLTHMRRNRSMTVSSNRSDTSVGMSDTSHETEAKLKRRHAIYRESCYMPYLGKSQGKNFVVLNENCSIPVLGTHRDLAKGATLLDSRANNWEQDAYPAETSGLALLHPPFELKPKNFARAGTPRIPNPGYGSVGPLKLSNLKNKLRTSPNGGQIVYPQIVLDLLRDIDEDIAQWGQS